MYLFGRTQMIPQLSHLEAIKFFKDSGFDGLEISPFDKTFSIRPEFFAPDFAKRMLEEMEKQGVKHFSVSAHYDYTVDKEHFDQTVEMLKVAASFGAPFAIINGAIIDPQQKYEDQWKRMIGDTRELCKIAGDLGLRLALEYEPNFVIGSTEQMLRGFDEIGSDVMAVNCDMGHFFLCDPDPLACIRQVAPYIVHCHVENMRTGVHDHCLPWDGDMDLGAYLATLKDVGFDGPMSLDVYRYEYADICKESAEYLRKLISSL